MCKTLVIYVFLVVATELAGVRILLDERAADGGSVAVKLLD